MSRIYRVNKNSSTLVFTGKTKSIERGFIYVYDMNTFAHIVIPNFVSSIGNDAFRDCPYVESVRLPNSVKNILAGAFHNCVSLASIHIPNSVGSIAPSVFQNCISVASVHIPNSISTIGSGVFMSCSSLAAIHIPNSVTSIGEWSFHHCSSLHKACLHGNSKISSGKTWKTFQPQTVIFRPRLTPITALQKKAIYRISKTPHAISL